MVRSHDGDGLQLKCVNGLTSLRAVISKGIFSQCAVVLRYVCCAKYRNVCWDECITAGDLARAKASWYKEQARSPRLGDLCETRI